MLQMISVGPKGELSGKELLFLAQHPEALAATLAKVEAAQRVLREQHDALDGKVALAGKAEEIVALREQAGRDAAQAAADREAAAAEEVSIREKATAEAERIISTATAEAANIVGVARTQADQIREAAETEKKNASARMATANQRHAELSAREAKAAEKEQAAQSALLEAAQIRDEFTRKHAALSAVIGELGK